VSRTADTADYTDQPIYWFAILDRAVERGAHAAAGKAQRELERLGVRVAYGIPKGKPPRTEPPGDR
jgi:hypothetical protein